MIPSLPSLGLSSSSSARSDAAMQYEGGKAGGGYRGSVVNNFALGGSKLSASTGFNELPQWLLWTVGGVALLGLVWFLRRKAS